MVENIARLNILEEEVNPEIILEDVLHTQDEWIFGLEQDVFFCLRVDNLPFLNQNILVNSFHGHLSTRLSMNNEEYLSE